MEDKLFWQIEDLASSLGPCFTIKLDKDLAKKLINTKVGNNLQEALTKSALDKFKINFRTPLNFYEDTAFIENFYLGENGVWLQVDTYQKKNLIKNKLEENLTYDAHNVDTTFDTYRLIGLFDLWMYYAPTLIEKGK
jgi:hypothetical protein